MKILNAKPKPQPIPNPNCHLIVDATWFGRDYCLLIYWDNDLHYPQWWRYSTGEISEEIQEDIIALRQREVICASLTSDGRKGITSSFQKLCPQAKMQRCIVHVQRLSLAYLTRNPKTMAGLELRTLVLKLPYIKNQKQKQTWLRSFFNWSDHYQNFLKERTYAIDGSYWWYAHRNLRKTKHLIYHAIPDLFTYLEDSNIPKSTNGLEGRFTDLKQKLRVHRGLKREYREAFLCWYLTIKYINRKRTK